MAQQYYAFALVVAILILSILEVRRYKRVVQKEYSDYEMLNINWLWRLIFAVVPIIIVWGADLVSIILGVKDGFGFELATWGLVVLFIYFVSFQAFKHKNLFEGVEAGQDPTDSERSETADGKHNHGEPVFGEEEDVVILDKIKTHMEDEEPYLDASLSIFQLSRQVDIPVRELSLLINHQLDKHFFDFVNEYRIKKAMELLRDPRHNKTTVLGILYEVGFNSKSSFNTVFKKFTGQTPSEYRKTGS
ncbi:MAG: AraC family transcriptional regulator [Bacteroidetes bacterium]|nr:MAG: AraC family transcriptional regulator [Bacteroidota bacterium]